MASTRHNPTIQSFKITTAGELAELEVVGAEIEDDQLELLLTNAPGVVYAYNQDGVLVEILFDMDGESIVATPVVLVDGQAVDHPAISNAA